MTHAHTRPAQYVWTGTRVARPVRDLARSGDFYAGLLGLVRRGGFRDHDGYDGHFFALPGGGELELVAGPVEPAPATEEDLLVLYLNTLDEVRSIAATLTAAGMAPVTSPNPYWNRFGQTFLDPDGYRIVIAANDRQPDNDNPDHAGSDNGGSDSEAEIGWYDGPCSLLRDLFELAEDSSSELDNYIESGRVLVARRAGAIVGHLQLVATARPGEIELKNMAIHRDHQGTGAGRALVQTAMDRCRLEGWSRMLVATAAAEIGNLRFYQRVGFRLLSIERDAFTPATGYPQPICIDEIPLLDRIWLSRDLA